MTPQTLHRVQKVSRIQITIELIFFKNKNRNSGFSSRYRLLTMLSRKESKLTSGNYVELECSTCFLNRRNYLNCLIHVLIVLFRV